MKRKPIPIRLLALFSALCLILAGCSAAFDKEYRYEEPYEEEYTELRSDSSIQEVKNYTGMKNALLNLINNAAEYGIIRTSKYNGSAGEDISKACFEVTRESPMGIYAVDFMTHSVTPILSYDEIEVHITYKRTAEEIAAVTATRSASELRLLLSETLSAYGTLLTVLQVSTGLSEQEIRDDVDRCYRDDPEAMPAAPQVTVTTYGSSSSIQEITEIRLDYGASATELSRRASALRTFLDAFFTVHDSADAGYIFAQVAERLSPEGEADTAYEALVRYFSGNSEGYAMSVKALCARAGIECYVVKGRMNNAEHFWNIVKVDGAYFHVDVFEADAGGEEPRLMSDSELLGSYWWDTSLYPACDTEPEATADEESAEAVEVETEAEEN